MKSFQAVILAAILAAASADNEPVASPTFFKQELAEYEHQLRNLQASFSVDNGDKGTPATSPPQDTPSRPTPGGSYSYSASMSYGGKGGKSGGGKGGKSGSGGSGKGGKSGSNYSYSTSMSYSSGKGGKSGGGSGKGGKSGSGSYSYSTSMSYSGKGGKSGVIGHFSKGGKRE